MLAEVIEQFPSWSQNKQQLVQLKRAKKSPKRTLSVLLSKKPS
jgi:hypothetical protein